MSGRAEDHKDGKGFKKPFTPEEIPFVKEKT